MVFFTWKELVRWLGVTVFEFNVHVLSLLLFSIFVALKTDGYLKLVHITWSWWYVFAPLFICNALCSYFCVIVFIRMLRVKDYRTTFMRAIWSLIIIIALFVCEVLYCKRLQGDTNLSYSQIFASIYTLIQLVTFKACHMQ